MKKEQILPIIKPLEWEGLWARGICGLYEIEKHSDKGFSLRFVPDNYNGENDDDFGQYPTIDDAKLAAEKLHQEDVLGYLNFEA